jgi:hypothetical protein
MIFYALGAVILIAVILRIYYRAEKNNMPRRTLKGNMTGIAVLLLIITFFFLKSCIKHDYTPAGQETGSLVHGS